ncbi:MerR family transcriptional regulator [Myxococcota bacterium]|nr:MerR family transcriptional regulator [Myxococcota bacterium]
MNPPTPPPTLKMRDLCDATGLNRQAIHFYIQQGLLPPGEKTGRNTATYTPAHLERLQLIRRLQHERFLPLEVIKDLLAAREDRYSDAQRGFLRGLRARLPVDVLGEATGEEVEAEGVLDVEDLHDLARLGLVRLRLGADGRPYLARADLPLARAVAGLRAAGLQANLGFGVDDLQAIVALIDPLVTLELGLLTGRLGKLPAEDVAPLVERTLPALNELLARLHDARLRAALEAL